MHKCIECNIKKVKTIIFHEFEFQKCYDCNYVRIFQKDFKSFVNLLTNKYNIGNIKHYDSWFNCNDYELKLLNDFSSTFEKFEINDVTKNTCDFCTEQLYNATFYKKFQFFFCKECGSIYFLQDDFNDFLSFLIKDLEKRNYILSIKVKLKIKIRKIILKIKEIFLHRRKKNNAKK